MVDPAEPLDCIIIGGGVAGLAAARTLVDAGKHVVIVEARARLGGRIYTRHDLADVPVELGGELIHGNQATTWSLIKKHHITTAELPGDQTSRDKNKPSIYDIDLSNMEPPTLDENIVDYFERVRPDLPLPQEIAFLDTDEEPLRKTGAAFLMRWYTEALRGGEVYGDHDFRVPDGYDQFLKPLAQDVSIEFGARVEQVTWGTAPTVTFQQHNTTRKLSAPHIIITLPIGVLQHNDVQFVPSLPRAKLSAIHALSTVDIAKLVYIFDEKIIADGIGLIENANGTPAMWWNGSFGAQSSDSVVVGWAAGDKARELLGMDYDAALGYGLDSLRQLLHSPNITPVKVMLHNWSGDPYTRGAYSFVPPGVTATICDILALPIDDVLFWAGEATASFDPATVHGAYSSGVRAAGEVLAVIGSKKKD